VLRLPAAAAGWERRLAVPGSTPHSAGPAPLVPPPCCLAATRENYCKALL
jgi:hypothetical protein